ncbi:MAG TPA: 3-hydroxyacyl-CoA dehydrogenase NAD-binding domain-containing protein, partial [Nitrososphaerales archaeon]|nr:3-hydroxyacyl-CoA dehydrogenase NAD-binding domain-containing protein [Nitrososphaerales archaeon]
AGYDVKLNDVSTELMNKGIKRIEENLSRSVEKGRLSEIQKKQIESKIIPTPDLTELNDCELIVEAALEKIEVKGEVFRNLDKICSKQCILASNTSSISVTYLASLVSSPPRVVGMHFFNPVPVMKLVEIVRALQTSDDTVGTIQELSMRLGKTAVVVKDSAGFVSNRVLCPMINEAIFALEEGVASKEDIDTVMKLGMSHPMGPLELADFVGLDIVLDVMEVLYKEFEDPKYRASPLLRRMVRAGLLGRKTGKGFYEYH